MKLYCFHSGQNKKYLFMQYYKNADLYKILLKILYNLLWVDIKK